MPQLPCRQCMEQPLVMHKQAHCLPPPCRQLTASRHTAQCDDRSGGSSRLGKNVIPPACLQAVDSVTICRKGGAAVVSGGSNRPEKDPGSRKA